MTFLSQGLIGWLEFNIWVYTYMHRSFSVSLCLVIFSLHPCAVVWHQTVTCNFYKSEKLLEGKYLCEDEKQGGVWEKEREKRAYNIEKKVSVREKAWVCEKKCVVCDSTSLYFCGEPQGGDFSLSLSQLSEIEGEKARRMCKDVEKGLEMILFPPPPFSLALSLLSQVWNFKKRTHSSQPTLQSEHSPCQNVIRCKILPQICPFPSLPHFLTWHGEDTL